MLLTREAGIFIFEHEDEKKRSAPRPGIPALLETG